VEALARFLAEKMTSRRIDAAQALSIAAVKTYDPPVDALVGLEVKGTQRRGKFLVIEVPPLFLALHLARAGWVRWHDMVPFGAVPRGKTPAAFRLRLDDGSGFVATEMGKEKRLAVYVVDDLAKVEGIARLGIDPLDTTFDVVTLQRLLARSGQVKNVLTDQSVIAGVGNAYSDEALHAARLSPFRSAAGLSDDEVATLHDALVTILRDAVERSAGLPAAGLKSEKKSGLRVHGRTGQPCPVCGDTVREVSFSTKSLQYCPTCQTGGRPLADRRFSRFLK